MEKIITIENLTEEERENLFIERAKAYVGTLNLPTFDPSGLKLARSENEIEKCRQLIEKAKHKAALRARDKAEKMNPKPRRENREKQRKEASSKKPKPTRKTKPLRNKQHKGNKPKRG